MYRSSSTSIWPWVVGALILVALAIPACNSYSKESTLVATVCGKEAVSNGSGHEYRVYTTEDTYAVKDHVLNGTSFRASNTYGRIEPHQVYRLTVYGWRIPVVSQFKNLVKAERVPDQKPQTC